MYTRLKLIAIHGMGLRVLRITSMLLWSVKIIFYSSLQVVEQSLCLAATKPIGHSRIPGIGLELACK